MKIGDKVEIHPSQLADEAFVSWKLASLCNKNLTGKILEEQAYGFYLVEVNQKYLFQLKSEHFKVLGPSLYRRFLAYVTLCIPAAMLARLVRMIFRKKGTKLEKKLMKYYSKKEKLLLGNN